MDIAAAGSLKLSAAQIQSAGTAFLLAKKGIDIGSLTTERQQNVREDGSNYRREAQTQEIGSRIAAAGDLTIVSGGRTGIRAGDVHAGGTLTVNSAENLHIAAGQNSVDFAESHYDRHSHIGGGSSRERRYSASSVQTAGSALSGGNVRLFSGSGMQIEGSRIHAQQNTLLQAAGNIDIAAAKNFDKQSRFAQDKRSGFTAGLDNGVLSAGYSKSAHKERQNQTISSLAQSQIDSIAGNTAIISGKDLTAEAALLLSGGDLHLQGRNVALNAAYTAAENEIYRQKIRSGIAAGITVNPAAAAKAAYNRNIQGGHSSGVVGGTLQKAAAAAKAIKAATTSAVLTADRFQSAENRQSRGIRAVGTSAVAQGNLHITAAGGNIAAESAKLAAAENALLLARENITLSSVRDSLAQNGGRRRSGFSSDNRAPMPAGTFRDSSKVQASAQQTARTQLFAGGRAVLHAQNADIDISGSRAVARGDLDLAAGGSITLRSAQNGSSHVGQERGSGIGTADISASEHFAGYMKSRQTYRSRADTHTPSDIGSITGNVRIQADGHYRQQSADITAGKNITVSAQSADIAENHNRSSSGYSGRDLKIGSFAKVSSPLIDAAAAVESAAAAEADGRTRTLQGAAAAAQSYMAADALGTGAALLKAEAGIGFKTASGSQNRNSSSAQGNRLSAGGSIGIRSTSGSIRLQNTQVAAADTVYLDSAADILLAAGENRQHTEGKNSSLGASVGVGVSVGAQTGIYAYAEIGGGKGQNRNSSQIYTPTSLQADTLRIAARGDTVLKGAAAAARRIDADIGGQLHIESLRNHSVQNLWQSSAGARVQISLGTAWEASGSLNSSRASGSSDSVAQQSGLFAGDGGYHIKAGGVYLKGGAIASAAPKENNELTAAGFGFENIENRSSAAAANTGISLDSGLLGGSKYAAARTAIKDYIAGTHIAQADHSTTYSILGDGIWHIDSADGQKAAAAVRKTVQGAHRTTAAADIRQMQDNADARRKAKGQLADFALTFSDEAHRTMFSEAADIYVLERDENGRLISLGKDGKGKEKLQYRKLTAAEKQHLHTGGNGKINISNNGIFTDKDSAAQYAAQHNPDAQYFVYFPQAGNPLSEMLVAGYMKFMENDILGLTNATRENKALMAKYGHSGIHFDAHSRGALTAGNALESLVRGQTYNGTLKNLSIRFVGPAYNVSKADKKLSVLQGRNTMLPEEAAAAELKYQVHKDDLVGTVIGNNPPTGGNSSAGKNKLQEWIGLGGDATVHSCYGEGNILCDKKDYWLDSPNKLPEWKPASFNLQNKD